MHFAPVATPPSGAHRRIRMYYFNVTSSTVYLPWPYQPCTQMVMLVVDGPVVNWVDNC